MTVWSVKQKKWGSTRVTVNAWIFLQVYFFIFPSNSCTTLILLRYLFLIFFFFLFSPDKRNLIRHWWNGKKKLRRSFLRYLTLASLSLLCLVTQESALNLALDNFTGSENRTDSAQHNTCSGRKASSKCPGHPELKRPSLGVKQCFGLGANSALVLSAVTANNRIN